jgi:hypothetical protein
VLDSGFALDHLIRHFSLIQNFRLLPDFHFLDASGEPAAF